MREKVEQILAAENGRRRTRTCHWLHAQQVIREAMENGYGYVNGGHVAAAYKYRAYTTCIFAWRCDAGIAIKVGTANAVNGSSPVTFAGIASKRERHILEFVAAHQDGRTANIIIPLREAVRLARREVRITATDRARMRALPNVLVTTADSIAAGNCASQTAKVASWFPGRTEVPARRLVARIDRKAPQLLPFAFRAVQTAARRLGV